MHSKRTHTCLRSIVHMETYLHGFTGFKVRIISNELHFKSPSFGKAYVRWLISYLQFFYILRMYIDIDDIE